MSKIRVNRLRVIKVHINYQGFIVWNNFSELLIPGAPFLCFFFGFQVRYKSGGCLVSEVVLPIKKQ